MSEFFVNPPWIRRKKDLSICDALLYRHITPLVSFWFFFICVCMWSHSVNKWINWIKLHRNLEHLELKALEFVCHDKAKLRNAKFWGVLWPLIDVKIVFVQYLEKEMMDIEQIWHTNWYQPDAAWECYIARLIYFQQITLSKHGFA